ncbi:unnamed protein product [Nezara viridula]|uniref:Uncharacterized protein n=1 Tax=Nezara viridula TaxID=85310 RepID=A0A9P0EDV2_NEZVI|nr:unnamed protein product [Nezara viridula]
MSIYIGGETSEDERCTTIISLINGVAVTDHLWTAPMTATRNLFQDYYCGESITHPMTVQLKIMKYAFPLRAGLSIWIAEVSDICNAFVPGVHLHQSDSPLPGLRDHPR